MKLFSRFIIVSLMLVSLGGNCLAGIPKVKEVKNGWYIQNHVQISYWVDTEAQLCFATYKLSAAGAGLGGFTVIDSNKLKKREEWKDIITW